MTPIHKHDCTQCVLLGTAKGTDIYLHVNTETGQDQIIMRYSSDGPDYEMWTVDYLRRTSPGSTLLYALGLYDGYQRALHDGLVQRGIDVAAAIINEGDGND